MSGLENRTYIEQSQDKVTAALLEYCRLVYPNVSDKYSQLLMRLPEIRLISIRTEDFLYFKHLSNEVPDQTLLTEMLHAKRRGWHSSVPAWAYRNASVNLSVPDVTKELGPKIGNMLFHAKLTIGHKLHNNLLEESGCRWFNTNWYIQIIDTINPEMSVKQKMWRAHKVVKQNHIRTIGVADIPMCYSMKTWEENGVHLCKSPVVGGDIQENNIETLATGEENGVHLCKSCLVGGDIQGDNIQRSDRLLSGSGGCLRGAYNLWQGNMDIVLREQWWKS